MSESVSTAEVETRIPFDPSEWNIDVLDSPAEPTHSPAALVTGEATYDVEKPQEVPAGTLLASGRPLNPIVHSFENRLANPLLHPKFLKLVRRLGYNATFSISPDGPFAQSRATKHRRYAVGYVLHRPDGILSSARMRLDPPVSDKHLRKLAKKLNKLAPPQTNVVDMRDFTTSPDESLPIAS